MRLDNPADRDAFRQLAQAMLDGHPQRVTIDGKTVAFRRHPNGTQLLVLEHMSSESEIRALTDAINRHVIDIQRERRNID